MDVKFRPVVTVVGGGLGGLAAAIRLAVAGCQVTVFERGEQMGGKVGTLEWEGFVWDSGPSLLTMPHVLADLWTAARAKLEDDVELLPLDPVCRYRWPEGTVLDDDGEFRARPEVSAFLAHGGGMHELGAKVLLHHPPADWHKRLGWRGLSLLRHLPKLADPRPMARTAAAFFPDSPQWQRVFCHQAARVGSSPFLAPSALHLLAYQQARYGAWYTRGGIAAIAQAMEKLARARGVRIECGQEVARLQENAGRWTIFHRAAEGGPMRPFHSDGIVCNMDARAAMRRFFDPAFAPKTGLSSSGFVIHAAIGREYPELAHHNVFFSSDAEREVADIFGTSSPAGEPTVSLSISSKSESGRAPEGCENWCIFVQAPTAGPDIEWTHFAPRYADRILGMLTRYGIEDPRPHVRWMRTTTPEDFEAVHLSAGGALYGPAIHSLRSLFQRPGATGPGGRFVFAEGWTRSGGGIPQVVLSGQIAARELLVRLGRPTIEMPEAGPT